MKLIRKGTANVERGTTFTGEVNAERAVRAHVDGGMSLSIIHFENGARTLWHTHPGEQILYVLEGQGRAGTESDEFSLSPGDVVYAAPCERHWHGAAPGHAMTHISVTTGGAPAWFGPPDE